MEVLAANQPRYWTPDPDLVAAACEMATGLVVDLGPGHYPLPIADARRVGWGWDNTDITVDRLPFDDQQVDFLYCRHTLEDLLDPCYTLREIARVAKSGWIETPSVTSELARRIDGGSPDWRGYHHHRSLFWSDGDTLITVPKYSMLEYADMDHLPIAKALEQRRAWNCVHVFSGGLKWKQLRHEVDFHIASGDYLSLVTQAVNAQASATARSDTTA